jgi:hypothetical protein
VNRVWAFQSHKDTLDSHPEQLKMQLSNEGSNSKARPCAETSTAADELKELTDKTAAEKPAAEQSHEHRIVTLENRVTELIEKNDKREQALFGCLLSLIGGSLKCLKQSEYSLELMKDRFEALVWDYERTVKTKKNSYYRDLRKEILQGVTDPRSNANGKLQQQFVSKSTLEMEFQKFSKGTVDELLGELILRFSELAQKFFTDTVTDLHKKLASQESPLRKSLKQQCGKLKTTVQQTVPTAKSEHSPRRPRRASTLRRRGRALRDFKSSQDKNK